jgi:hypothetical protein
MAPSRRCGPHRPDEVVKTGVYRPPPDPRRTRRQRFIDLFSDDLDRSNDPPPHTRAGRMAKAGSRLLGRLLDLAFPFYPLVAVLLDFSAIDLVLIGAWWCTVCIRRLTTQSRARRRPGTGDVAP